MRAYHCAVVFLLVLIAGNQVDQYSERHDATAYFVAHNSPYPLVDFDREKNEDTPHVGSYAAGGTMTYKVVRDLYLPLPVTGSVTRRIVRRFSYQNATARQPIFSYPVQLGVEIRPQDHIAFSHVELPDAKTLPPDEYILEVSVSFMYRGDTKTYVSETQPFRVLK